MGEMTRISQQLVLTPFSIIKGWGVKDDYFSVVFLFTFRLTYSHRSFLPESRFHKISMSFRSRYDLQSTLSPFSEQDEYKTVIYFRLPE